MGKEKLKDFTFRRKYFLADTQKKKSEASKKQKIKLQTTRNHLTHEELFIYYQDRAKNEIEVESSALFNCSYGPTLLFLVLKASNQIISLIVNLNIGRAEFIDKKIIIDFSR